MNYQEKVKELEQNGLELYKRDEFLLPIMFIFFKNFVKFMPLINISSNDLKNIIKQNIEEGLQAVFIMGELKSIENTDKFCNYIVSVFSIINTEPKFNLYKILKKDNSIYFEKENNVDVEIDIFPNEFFGGSSEQN